MLQIRLSKPANETGGTAKPATGDTVTVACPDHLVLADLPVAKGLGTASASAVIKTVGRRSRRQFGERVHFCVRCDFPIGIYGRLSPCEHVFCLDCARSDSLCYLCDERIQKIQTIKLMEGIYVCAAPHCLKSFLKKTDFESHIHGTHADLLHPDQLKEVNESEARKYSASESTVQAPPPRLVFSPNSNQAQDRDDRSQRGQSREQPPSRPLMNSGSVSPFPGQAPNHSSDQQTDNYQPQVFDRGAPQNHFPHQTFDAQGGMQQNSGSTPPQFGGAPYASDGTPQFFGAPYEISRQDSTSEAGPEQRSLPPGFRPGPVGPMNFPQNYPRPPWINMNLGSVPLEPPMVSQGTPKHGYMNIDPQGRGFFQGEHGQSMGVSPVNMPPPAANTGGSFVVPRDGKGMPAPQQGGMSLPPPPPIPPPPHLSQLKRGRSFSGDENNDAPPGFGWQQPERRGDGFRGGQD